MTFQITLEKKCKSKKECSAGQPLLWLWINKTKRVSDKESYLCWIFINGPGYFFTEKKDILGLAMLI